MREYIILWMVASIAVANGVIVPTIVWVVLASIMSILVIAITHRSVKEGQERVWGQ